MPRPIRASAAIDWLANQNPLSVVEWADPVVEAAGHPERSVYVETFWLPPLGPTAMWLLRRLSAWLEATPDGISVELPALALELGLGANVWRSHPVIRTPAPLLPFHAPDRDGDDPA